MFAERFISYCIYFAPQKFIPSPYFPVAFLPFLRNKKAYEATLLSVAAFSLLNLELLGTMALEAT